MQGLRLTLSIKDIPEVVAGLRDELADAVRARAAAEEDPEIARQLREAANNFGSVQGPPDAVVVDVEQQSDGSFAPHDPLVRATRRA